jgi:acyl-CoA synthetase (AMP-forming)/AMP-acid ligase II
MLSLLEGEGAAVVAPGLRISRAELRDASLRLAARLHVLGFTRGDRLAVWLPDGAGWLQCLFAAARLGLLVVPISTRFTTAEARRVVGVAQPRGLVVPESFLKFDYAAASRELAAEMPGLQVLVAPAHGLLEGAEGEPPASGEPADLLCTFSTSGTTGMPKLAPHDQASILRHARNVAAFFDMNQGDASLGALPLCGVLGFMQCLATLAAVGRWVSVPVYDPVACARAIDAEQVTHFFGSDQMFDAVLSVPEASLTSWRIGGYAEFVGWGAEVAAKADARGIRLVGLYGSSEGFSLMAGRDWRAPLGQRARNGGTPIAPGIAFRICDPETGAELPKGQPGELQLRGYNLLPHYLNNVAATEAAFTTDGWFRSGDLCLDEGGSFLYLARLKDSLRLRGYLVDPGEIEAHLAAHPAVGQAQVVGLSEPGRGDVAVAFAILRAPAEEGALLAHCREGLAAYKQPCRVLAVTEFPANNGPNGVKILKNKLREMAEAALRESQG